LHLYKYLGMEKIEKKQKRKIKNKNQQANNWWVAFCQKKQLKHPSCGWWAARPPAGRCWRCIFVLNFNWTCKRTSPPSLLTVNSCIEFCLDSQAYKSPVVVKGPFFPRVVNPRYRIRGTNVWRKSWSSKAK
jgi:hypothetical protein